jgi:hypothetical protein
MSARPNLVKEPTQTLIKSKSSLIRGSTQGLKKTLGPNLINTYWRSIFKISPPFLSTQKSLFGVRIEMDSLESTHKPNFWLMGTDQIIL